MQPSLPLVDPVLPPVRNRESSVKQSPHCRTTAVPPMDGSIDLS